MVACPTAVRQTIFYFIRVANADELLLIIAAIDRYFVEVNTIHCFPVILGWRPIRFCALNYFNYVRPVVRLEVSNLFYVLDFSVTSHRELVIQPEY